ncbi:hypothetical protein [Metabacillus sp. cB07]|uniref:hypothetical protein n=1 Tax=Metabacillus sp. cB07 TaxID=2806989 RepID=UPI00193A75A1|nr:hypothetical protein [Metabacillus sp. cB07]
MKNIKLGLWGILGFPIGLVIYFIYIHVVSLIDPILTIWFGGAVLLALIFAVFLIIKNVSYVIYTMFKKDRGVDEKGFKNF